MKRKTKVAKAVPQLISPRIPKVPQEIFDSIERKNLILFVGAGVSKLMGYPLWKELGKKLADVAVKKHLMSLSEEEVLLSGLFQPMQIVSVACDRLDKNGFYSADYIRSELSDKKCSEVLILDKISKYLSAFNSTIVTTNADNSLDNSRHLSDMVQLKSFINYTNDYYLHSIIHLHGSVDEPDNLVFTSEKYAKSYNIENKFGEKLRELLRNNPTILFIGYGNSEFELIKYFLSLKNNKERKMFMLEGYLDKDTIKYNFDKIYFDSLGITLLPYSREKDNYLALLKVLKKWSTEVSEKTFAGSINRVDYINGLLSNKPNDVSIDAVERLVNKNGRT